MCVFILCLYVAALRRDDPSSKQSFRVCIDLGTDKAAKAHQGSRAIDR
jgi:hypothetical protein